MDTYTSLPLTSLLPPIVEGMETYWTPKINFPTVHIFTTQYSTICLTADHLPHRTTSTLEQDDYLEQDTIASAQLQ
ncbi:hypothetical protein E6O75_ATG04835 [Venturia nashicola]|uniref:Uncharacterized protein n=1 Tax=Venturia nashicola TaxID=86259 RepID=A0A4Z1P127_9PEZI|nr:hypothetical protein E6O75_ATG04835 [Venturia nashicola]